MRLEEKYGIDLNKEEEENMENIVIIRNLRLVRKLILLRGANFCYPYHPYHQHVFSFSAWKSQA